MTHMIKNILLLAAIVAASAGKAQLKRFPNMDKWILPDIVDKRPLHGHPRQVTQYSILPGQNDSAARGYYLVYRFDADGDINYKATYASGRLQSTEDYRFDENGAQSKFVMVQGKGFSSLQSRALGEHAYRSILTAYHRKAILAVDSFPPGGRQQIETRYEDTVSPGKILSSTHIYFDGDSNMIATIVDSSQERGRVEWRYFRSRCFMPDSIQVWVDDGSGPTLIDRGVYFNNAHGDPERYLKIAGADTILDTRYQYIYDPYGNWTKLTEKDVKFDPRSPGYGDNVATIREYVY
jgi:hypothetical protein